MPRITPPALLLPAVAALVLSGGCTTAVSGAASADSAAVAQDTGEAVAWVDRICGSLLPYIQAAVSRLNPAEAPDAVTLVQDISDHFSRTEESAGSAITGMEAAGPSPVTGGDEIVDRLSSKLETVKTTLRDARTRIERVNIHDRQALLREVPAAVETVNTLSPMPDLQLNPTIAQAGREAAGCQQITREFGG